MEDSFSMQAHLAFASKIAQAAIHKNIWQEGGIDVVGVSSNTSNQRSESLSLNIN
jgi:hypothetical protein